MKDDFILLECFGTSNVHARFLGNVTLDLAWFLTPSRSLPGEIDPELKDAMNERQPI
jgi:hypothetical protein